MLSILHACSLFLRDAGLYLRLIRMQIQAQAQYKINLLLDIVTYLFTTVFEFIGVLLFFGPFPTLLGWHVGEVVLLTAIMSFSFGLAEMIGAGIDNFAETIRRGEFDRVLLRPVGVFTQVIGSDFRLRRLGRLTQGAFAFIIALRLLPNLHWSIGKLLVLFIGIGSGATIFVTILLLGATVCFWTIETTELTNILTYGGREMLSYPLTIYHQVLQRFFLFVVPVAFSSYVPTCYILGRPLPFGLSNALAFAGPLAAALFAFVAAFVWRYGVHHYQSTGN
ncbi:MAG: ABC-2 family transporter protein [Ktedonobacteraceae bacterium]|nr:ABC-2 family transporter protein [Ktedonobacteraceae bacterium]